MLILDNVTTIYLTGLVAIAFAATQLIFFRKKGVAAYLWAAGTALIGCGYIVTLLNNLTPLPDSWVIGPIAVLLGSLVTLSALGMWAGYQLPKKATLICLGGVGITAALFHFSRLFGAPLGSLEAILLAPLAAALIYTGWFAGVQAMQTRSKYIVLISAVFWVQGLMVALLTLGALAAKGNDYIVVTSEIVYWVSLINLAVVLISNISWSIQISEDLLVSGGVAKSSTIMNPFTKAKSEKKTGDINTALNTEIHTTEKPVKEKVTNKRAELKESVSINPDLLSETEKLSLLEKLTDKEREVFLLAAEGKKNGEIATILNSSEASVKVHRSRMTGKLGMKKPEDLKKLIQGSSATLESKEIQEEKSEVEQKSEDQDLFTKNQF